MKLCVITCYTYPDYIRAVTLRAAVLELGHDLIVIKNKRTGMLRYVEVVLRLIIVRIRLRPDAYVLTFRGYEMLLPTRLLTLGRPLLYDEFINPIEWVVKEARKVEPKTGANIVRSSGVRVLSKIVRFVVSSSAFRFAYRLLLRSTALVLTDTVSHAEISAEITGMSHSKFQSIPVGTDEDTFMPDTSKKESGNKTFTVLYYGNMLPLHGLQYVIEAAERLRGQPIMFTLVGGSEKTKSLVENAMKNGAMIIYRSWVPYDELPALMHEADLCLAGPFGGTFQSNYVITGKAYQFLAMAKPTIVGRNEESHIFKDRQNTLIVDQASTESLVESIEWAFSHRSELITIGRNGRKLYDDAFSIRHIADALRVALSKVSSK